jgi:hypothetical protein
MEITNATFRAFTLLPQYFSTTLTNCLHNTSSERIWAGVAIVAVTYPLLVSTLRFRRMKEIEKEFHFPTRESMAKMTDDQAWKIQLRLSQLEFPFTYVKSLQFALFRVCAPLQESSINNETKRNFRR